MANFLGPNYGPANQSAVESLFNEVKGSGYDYDTYYDGITNLDLYNGVSTSARSLMFVLSAAATVTSIDVWLRKVGATVNNITPTLHAEGVSFGIPGAAVLATGATVLNANLTTSYQRVKITFPFPVLLNASQNYYLVLTTANSGVGNYFQVAGDATPVGFPRSASYNSSTVTWTVGTSRALLDVFYLATTRLGQGFVAAGDQQVEEVHLWLKKTGSPTGNLIVEVYNDLLGAPDIDSLVGAASSSVSASGLTTTATEQTFTFSPPINITDGQRYHIVISATGTYTSANFVSMDTDAVLPTFSSGEFSTYNLDGSWQVFDSKDAIFEIYYFEQAPPDFLSDSLALLGSPPLDCHAQQVWLQALVNTLSSFFPSTLPPQYGGTGVGNYETGDMLYASSPYHLERLSIGSPGQALGVTEEGMPAWGANSGALVTTVVNASSTDILYEGMAVVWTPTSTEHRKVTTTTKQSDRRFAGIIQATILPGEEGPMVTQGITRVLAGGNISSGADFPVFADVSGNLSSVVGGVSATLLGYGPIRILSSGNGGALVYGYVNAETPPNARASFKHEVAFNVQGGTLTSATWTQVPLNLDDAESHELFTLAANVMTAVVPGYYRVRAQIPITGSGTITQAVARLRKLTGAGSPSDLAVFRTPVQVAPAASGVVAFLDEMVSVVAGETFELQAYATGSLILRAGNMHNLTGFNNVYSTIEWERMPVNT